MPNHIDQALENARKRSILRIHHKFEGIKNRMSAEGRLYSGGCIRSHIDAIEVELEDFCLEGLGILGRNEPEHSGVRARHFKNLKNIIAELSAEHIDEFKLSFARIACEFPEGVVEKSGVVDIRLIEKLRLQVDEHLYVFNSKTSFWKWAFGDLRKRIWTGFLILIGATITAGFDWLIAYLE